MCSKLFSTAQSENSSQSIGILHQLCFQNNYSMLTVNSKIGRFVKLILFAELALPSWLRQASTKPKARRYARPKGGHYEGRGLTVNSKIGRFVKLILFAELALPSWLRQASDTAFNN